MKYKASKDTNQTPVCLLPLLDPVPCYSLGKLCSGSSYGPHICDHKLLVSWEMLCTQILTFAYVTENYLLIFQYNQPSLNSSC